MNYKFDIIHVNPIFTGEGGKFALSLSYYNMALQLKKSFAFMHPDFE